MNGLIAYDNPNVVGNIEKLGTLLAKGGLYGCKNAEQGSTLVLMSMAEGIPITEMKRRYHIMNTKHGSTLAMRADFMLAEFRRLGGEFTWVDQGDDGQKATLRVKYRTNDIEVTFTLDDAKRQGLVKKGGNWETVPDAMLRSRAITKAVRMVCPEVLAGFNTDDEIEGNESVPFMQGAVSPPAEASPSPASPPAGGSADHHECDVVDAEYEVQSDEANKATGEQLKRVRELFEQLGVGVEAQLRAFQATGARDMGDLSREGADQIIARMEAAAKPTEAEGDDRAATDEQIAELKKLIEQVAQVEGMGGVPAEIKQHLNQNGISKLAQLARSSADQLIACLSVAPPRLDAFFDTPPQSAGGGE